MGRTSGDSGWPESAPPLLALVPFPFVVVVTSLEEEPLGGVSGKWTPAKEKRQKQIIYGKMHRWERRKNAFFPFVFGASF